MPVTRTEELKSLVDHILDDLSGLSNDAEDVADALAIAFAQHCKKAFNTPSLGRPHGFVDTTLVDTELGTMEVRVTVFRKIPPVDRNKKYDV